MGPQECGLLQLRHALAEMPRGDHQPHVLRALPDTLGRLLGFPPLLHLRRRHASHLHPHPTRNGLWSSWEVLCGHSGGEWVHLAPILGDPVLASFSCRRLPIHSLSDPPWPSHNISQRWKGYDALLGSKIGLLCHPGHDLAWIVWIDALCFSL